MKADVITGKSKRVCEEGYEPGTEDCWGGNLLGTFTFTLELRDHHHGETLRRGSKSWSGSILEGLGFWRARGDEPISNLVKAMFPPGDPLDKVIRDYERIPETCKVRWTRDQLQAGEVQTIYLENAVDAEGRPTRWWQRVIVGVDKGKILNGEQYEGLDLWVFQVGKDGRVEVEYQAPPECRNTSVTLTVFNTCDKHENEKCGESLKKYYPEKEIARKVFEVVCDQWALEVTYREDLTTNRRGPLGDNLFVDHAGRNLVWSAKAILKPLRDPRSARGRSELEAVEQTRKSLEADDAEQSQRLAEVERRLRKRLDERARRAAQHPVYFATSADIKLKDSFNRIYRWFFRDRQAGEMKVAEWQVSWNSDWKGSVPLTPELVLNAEKGWYRLRLSAHRDGIEKPAKFFVPFEFDYRSWNVSTRVLQCTGTADVLHPVPDLDIPDDLLIYDGKQRELRGERTWNDVLSGLAPIAEPPGCGGKNPFSEGISIGSLPDLPRAFKKTVTWTLRKLED